MATIVKRIKRNGTVTYQAKVRKLGHEPVTGTFTRLTDAKVWAENTEVDMRNGRYFKSSEAKKHTLDDLIDRYIRDELPGKKSAANQKQQLLWWKKQIGKKLLVDVTPALVSETRDKLIHEPILYSRKEKQGDGSIKILQHEKKRTPATANRYLAALSHVFTMAVNEWQWVDSNPVRKVKKRKESRGRVRFLSDDERVNLLAACMKSKNKYLYLVVVLALSTGMRLREALYLKWTDVDFERMRIILNETKNEERRPVPLTGLAFDLMKQLSEEKKSVESVFAFPSRFNKGKTPVDIRKAWLNALKTANIEDFRFHDNRHSTASYLAMNNATLAEIAEVLGHKTLQMVKRYAHLSEQHTAKVVASMNTKIFGISTKMSILQDEGGICPPPA
jgi:integrase